MHPDMHLELLQRRSAELASNAEHQRHHYRPRPPSRHLRRRLAAQLIRLADRIDADPSPGLARRA
jgi:hypothetical protein